MTRSALVCAAAGLALAPGLASAQTSFFDVFTELSISDGGPSDSSAGLSAGTMGAAGYEPVEHMGAGWNSTRLNGLPPGVPWTAELRLSDSGGGPGSPGARSFFDIFVDFNAPQGNFDSFFDVFFDLRDPGGSRLTMHKPVQANFAPSFFDIFVEIDLPSGMIQRHHLHGQPAPGSQFIDGGIRGGGMGDSFFDVFFEVSFDRDVGSGERHASITMDGSQVPAPGALAALGTLALIGLRRRR